MKNRIEQIEKELEALGYIAALWHVDDVRRMRPDLSDVQCREVLRNHKRHHNSEVGINWDSISAYADALYPESECDAGKGGAV